MRVFLRIMGLAVVGRNAPRLMLLWPICGQRARQRFRPVGASTRRAGHRRVVKRHGLVGRDGSASEDKFTLGVVVQSLGGPTKLEHFLFRQVFDGDGV